MTITDPRTGKAYFWYYTDPAFVRVERGTKVKCGGSTYYLHEDEPIRNFADFWKLKVVD